MVPAVELRGVSRDYRVFWRTRPLKALQTVNLTVSPGEVLGIVGPNGSGKSTLLKVVLGLVRPTCGEARVFGAAAGSVEARRAVGYLPDAPSFYRHLTGRELLEFYGRLCGLARPVRGRRIAEVLDEAGIGPAADRRIAAYSRGMLQRLGFAQAILHDPRLLILDEPGNGLDPEGIEYVDRMLTRLRTQGKTVLIASHLLAQLEGACDRVGVLVDGQWMRIESMRGNGLGGDECAACLWRDRLGEPERRDLERWMEDRGVAWSGSGEPRRPRLEAIYCEAVAQVRGRAGDAA